MAPSGSAVTIAGSNFGSTQGSSTVTFNGAQATAVSWSNSSITAVVPPGATSGNVVVQAGSLSSNPFPFTVGVAPSREYIRMSGRVVAIWNPPTTVLPVITSLSINTGAVGAAVTINGNNFGASQPSVTFNGTSAGVTSWTATSIQTSVPSGATTGNVVVTAGGLPSNGVLFTVTEVVSTPNQPSGVTSGSTGTSYTYTVGGSTSSAGNAVQYLINWGDGTNSNWLATGVVTASHAWSVAGTYSVTAQARSAVNQSVVSGISQPLSVTLTQPVETVSTPTMPSGPATGWTNTSNTYTTGGSTSSFGNSVQYQFYWGDGMSSGWLATGATSASHPWSAAGTYQVTAQARSAANPSAVSLVSSARSVVISQETVSTPSQPTGATNAYSGNIFTYATGGSVSSRGSGVQYSLNYSDGVGSGWLATGTTSAPRYWNIAPGTYTVTAQARSAGDTSVLSGISPALGVTLVDSVPSLNSFTPSGSGTTQTFTLQASDYAGATAITDLQALFSPTYGLTNLNNSCHLWYQASDHTLWLDSSQSDWNFVGHGVQGGGWFDQTSNGVCQVNSWSVSTSGNALTLSVSLTFQISGTWWEYMHAQNATGGTGWATNNLTWSKP